jgi:hypothetical protein
MLTPSHENWLSELNDVVRRYRHPCNDPKTQTATQLAFDQAIQRLEDLGFTRGEAMHVLRNRQPTPAAYVTLRTAIPSNQRKAPSPVCKPLNINGRLR